MLLQAPIQWMLQQFYDAALAAVIAVMPAAQWTLLILFFIHFTWKVSLWVLQDRSDFWPLLVTQAAIFAFAFFGLVAAPVWIPQIPESFGVIGSLTTGIDQLRPSAFAGLAVELAASFGGVIGNYLVMFDVFFIPIRFVSMLWILFAFGLIAWQLVRVQLETSLHVGGLIYMVSFAGHPSTWGLFAGYLRSLFAVSIHIFILYALLGVAFQLGIGWLESFSTIDLLTLEQFFTILLAAPLLPYLIWTVPKDLANKITSSWTIPSPYP